LERRWRDWRSGWPLQTLYERLGDICVVTGQDQVFLPVVTLDSRLHMQVTW
jgi:hypothetical protein